MAALLSRKPDPSIEEIESELLRAKFAENPAEQYLSQRAKLRMQQADIARAADERVKAAFLAGYRLALSEPPGPWKSFVLGALLMFTALGVLFTLALVQSY